MKSVKIITSVALASVLFVGCATIQLQTNAKMSQSIFINPVASSKKLIFIATKNTSGQNVNIQNQIENLLTQRGYKIVDDPEIATYILMSNILYCDKKSENNAAGAAVTGGAIGSSIGAYNHGSITGTIAGGAIGAAVTGIIGKLTEDTIYQMQVDIIVREKAKGKVTANKGNVSGQASVADKRKSGFFNEFGGEIRRDEASGNFNSNSTNYDNQVFERDYTEQKTTIFAEATKSGLNLNEAIPILENKIASQIAGLF
ncbi:complement resistance protein TraT [Campylobacter pinnipediorum]|uniref:Conjugal transfer protein TraT n=1 Tax=Campylobacter pinnipediorum subsp. pinnipediorum TaxID=1660067 RepID=A0AAX0LBM4_9BACT|nr:complement resistance protein TraT [Campylobacter pinnipediorum]AQW81412.1 putative TraT complement resistance protein [Campylobacter pinnipediorum subsp. pinnipediorum]AQW83040.1 putative TraT complement resistance protein [Campylobacter pinnipediorum subsp. pinnipediorum]AQW84608.1 putative TraT complement resistance protein [Campylobacter pinnipediorum subsp. pinnipediorum]OPA78252.1 conjugal transfer protein TraT [Campylobacter pinnipediorum subsp. pinnipediorum]OPA81916.1 conjugal tran